MAPAADRNMGLRTNMKEQALPMELPGLCHNKLPRSQWHIRVQCIFVLCWPLLAVTVGLHYIWSHLDHPSAIDAQYSYLPAARALLENGWSFLLTPESYRVVPLAYLWPAIWGADPTTIRLAHMVLWVGCIWFLWRICVLMGGYRAGIVAMLFALNPELVRYFPSELTEPIFLFGLFGWMHTMARIFINGQLGKGVIAQGAFMLTITLLSRPVLQLLVPLVFLLCISGLVIAKLSKRPLFVVKHAPQIHTVAWILVLSLAAPAALVIKNGLTFGLWGLGTGSGIGLYLGSHPLFQGTEPGFLGFDFDVNLLAGLAGSDHSHSWIADKATRSAALWQLQSMSWTEGLAFFGRKLWWWIAHHPTQIDAYGSVLRKMRFFELLLVISALLWTIYLFAAKRPLGWLMSTRFSSKQWGYAAFLLFMLCAMLAQMLPILYNSRYSSALLDPWLIPLAAFGFSLLTSPFQSFTNAPPGHAREQGTYSWIHKVGSVLIIIVLVTMSLAGYLWSRNLESIAIDPQHMGSTRIVLSANNTEHVYVHGMEPIDSSRWVTTAPQSTFRIRVSQREVDQITAANPFNAMWETDITISPMKGLCGHATFAYVTDSGQVLQSWERRPLTLALRNDGQLQQLVVHANHELRPHQSGSLQMAFDCPVGTTVKWHGTHVLESRHAFDAAHHLSSQRISQ
jgi:hypothetical protein